MLTCFSCYYTFPISLNFIIKQFIYLYYQFYIIPNNLFQFFLIIFIANTKRESL